MYRKMQNLFHFEYHINSLYWLFFFLQNEIKALVKSKLSLDPNQAVNI